MKKHNNFKWIGGTRDDAAGECFDKVARVLGLNYPGGPEIEKVAGEVSSVKCQVSDIRLPRPMIDSNNFDFSFSGLKTAVVNHVNQMSNLPAGGADVKGQVPAIAHEFQKAVIDVLVKKTVRAAKKFRAKSIVVGGGVTANKLLRSQLTVHGLRLDMSVKFPSIEFCIDNGAMIAATANYNFFLRPIDKIYADSSLHF